MGAPPKEPVPKAKDRCCVNKFRYPDEYDWSVTAIGDKDTPSSFFLEVYFSVIAEYDDKKPHCNCACCEFHQLVKRSFVGGFGRKENKATGFVEDCSVGPKGARPSDSAKAGVRQYASAAAAGKPLPRVPKGGWKYCFGDRKGRFANIFANEIFLPCQYWLIDIPQENQPAGQKFVWDMQFRGEIRDRCNGGTVVPKTPKEFSYHWEGTPEAVGEPPGGTGVGAPKFGGDEWKEAKSKGAPPPKHVSGLGDNAYVLQNRKFKEAEAARKRAKGRK